MADLGVLLEDAAHRTVRYGRGQAIYDVDDAANGLFRVDKGCVRLQVVSEMGERQVIAFLFPGEFFGFSIDSRGTSAEAVTEIQVTRYSISAVLDLTLRSRQVTFQLMRAMNHAYADLARHVEQVAHLTAAERVTCFLSDLAQREHVRPGEAVAIPMMRRDMSDYLGLAPETLSRTLHELEGKGEITFRSPRTFVFRRHLVEARIAS